MAIEFSTQTTRIEPPKTTAQWAYSGEILTYEKLGRLHQVLLGRSLQPNDNFSVLEFKEVGPMHPVPSMFHARGVILDVIHNKITSVIEIPYRTNDGKIDAIMINPYQKPRIAVGPRLIRISYMDAYNRASRITIAKLNPSNRYLQ